jgi:hypothetical protein
MLLFIKNGLLAVVCFLLLSAFSQRDTLSVSVDSSIFLKDSNFKKDTLLIKYIAVLPKSFQQADAWFIESLHTSIGDSTVDILKDYKKYFNERGNGFKLYYKGTKETKAHQLIFKIEQRFSLPDKDFLFYIILLLLFLYGFVSNLYPQYFPKLFSQFSQNSLRMLQNREQLLQNSVASLVVNICFLISFSLLGTLLIFNRHLLPISFWEGYLYVSLFVVVLYLGKYLCLQIAGYIFNTIELVNTYIFIVFMINKVLGILLLPFILVLAFANPVFHSAAIWGAGSLTLLLILYRYLFSLTSVRNKLHISSFHFFLYLCAFEVLPLLILYKFVVQYFGGTY